MVIDRIVICVLAVIIALVMVLMLMRPRMLVNIPSRLKARKKTILVFLRTGLCMVKVSENAGKMVR